MYLKKGDTIALVSPARCISQKALKPAIDFFEKHGLHIIVGKHAYNVHHQMAGTDDEKVEDIQKFIYDPEIKAIVSTRGGYGSVRVIDKLNFEPLVQQNKWFVGYSDITVFHSHIHRNFGIPTIHSTMPVNISTKSSPLDNRTNESLIAALMGQDLLYDLSDHTLNVVGNAKGILVGGNLSILYSLCGSNSDLDTRGKILFLEDVDEYLYHIDRMMMNLKRTRKLESLAALVVGGMTNMRDNDMRYGKSACEIILEHTQEYRYPVYFDFQAGHCQPNVALRFGLQAEIKNNQLLLHA